MITTCSPLAGVRVNRRRTRSPRARFLRSGCLGRRSLGSDTRNPQSTVPGLSGFPLRPGTAIIWSCPRRMHRSQGRCDESNPRRHATRLPTSGVAHVLCP
jgi:hypothetical protein